MRALRRRITDTVRHYRYAASQVYWSLRRGRPGLDHLVRAVERYVDCHGNQLAASVAYFAFLSFFPLLALAFAAVGYAATLDVEVRGYLERTIEEILPGLARQLPLDQVARARLGASLAGVFGLVYTSLGAVGALRNALRAIWLRNDPPKPDIVLIRLVDLLVVLVLGAALVGSVALTGFAEAATRWLLALLDVAGSTPAVVATRLLGIGAAIGMDTVIFLVVFGRMSGTDRPWWTLWRGALLAAVGFEAFKALGVLLVRGTLDNPVYASFAVLVGLLVWLNLVARLVVFAAAWTATWLPVAPPYEDTVPVTFPVTTSDAEPSRPVFHRERSARHVAGPPVRAGARAYVERVTAVRRRTRLALVAAFLAGVAAGRHSARAGLWCVRPRRSRAAPGPRFKSW